MSDFIEELFTKITADDTTTESEEIEDKLKKLKEDNEELLSKTNDQISRKQREIKKNIIKEIEEMEAILGKRVRSTNGCRAKRTEREIKEGEKIINTPSNKLSKQQQIIKKEMQTSNSLDIPLTDTQNEESKQYINKTLSKLITCNCLYFIRWLNCILNNEPRIKNLCIINDKYNVLYNFCQWVNMLADNCLNISESLIYAKKDIQKYNIVVFLEEEPKDKQLNEYKLFYLSDISIRNPKDIKSLLRYIKALDFSKDSKTMKTKEEKKEERNKENRKILTEEEIKECIDEKGFLKITTLVKSLEKEGLKTTTKDEKEFLLNNNEIKDYIKEYSRKIRIMKTDDKTPFEMLKNIYFDFDEGL